MQDITIAGASYNDVPSVQIPKTGGGSALFVDTSDTTATAAGVKNGLNFYLSNGSPAVGNYVWNFKGDDPELVKVAYAKTTTALEDTNFATWTPSSTAAAIVATSNATTFSADMVNYDYLIRWKFVFDAVYPSGTTMKAVTIRAVDDIWQAIIRRPNSLANIAAKNFAGNSCMTLFTGALMEYYNSSGSHTYTFATSYGIYASATAATFSNATSNTPTVTVKTPAINARCSTTYFSTANAGVIDQANSTVSLYGEVYRVKTGAVMRSIINGVIDLFDDGIT